jgi:hypothetical protein
MMGLAYARASGVAGVAASGRRHAGLAAFAYFFIGNAILLALPPSSCAAAWRS